MPHGARASFFGWANLGLNVALGAGESLASLRAAYHRVEALQDELGTRLDLRLRPGQCSEGMLQQAAILRALCRQPDLLLADEPFSSLDIHAARTLRRAVREAVTRRSMAAVVVLHDLESVVELADRVLVIPGRPWSGTAQEGFVQVTVLPNRRRPAGGHKLAPPSSSVTDLLRVVLGSEAPNG